MKKILIVEDHPANRKLARDILLRAGYEVLEARNAREGIRQANSFQPALIVMDIQLPGMSGLAATKVLKDDSATSRIPILALSAHAMPGDHERFLEGGCDAYLSKPLRYARFLSLVHQLLTEKPRTLGEGCNLKIS